MNKKHKKTAIADTQLLQVQVSQRNNHTLCDIIEEKYIRIIFYRHQPNIFKKKSPILFVPFICFCICYMLCVE